MCHERREFFEVAPKAEEFVTGLVDRESDGDMNAVRLEPLIRSRLGVAGGADAHRLIRWAMAAHPAVGQGGPGGSEQCSTWRASRQTDHGKHAAANERRFAFEGSDVNGEMPALIRLLTFVAL